jgi:hypothetical protein
MKLYGNAESGASTRRRWMTGGLGVAAAVGLASCGGGDDRCDNCFNTPQSEISYGLVAGDFAGNGLSSLILTDALNGPQPNAGQLLIYLSNAPGSYPTTSAAATGNQPTYLASADLDQNGLPDVVAANAQDGTLSVFLNGASNTAGLFATPLTLSSPGASQLAIADMNGDGLPDLVSADFNVSLFLQSSPGVFANPIALSSSGANWVAAGDLNGDGFPDVALTDQTGVSLVYYTGTPGVYSAPVQIYAEVANPDAVGANIVAIADVNNDGFNDLIITDPGPRGGNSPTVSVLLQDPTSPGTYATATSYATAAGSLASSIEVTDIDGDGYPDIVIGGSSGVSVLVNQGAAAGAVPGTFFAADNYSAANANQVAIADVNGDGLPDIVTTTGVTHPLVNGVYQNNPGILLQNPSKIGFFTALQDLP